MSHSASDPPSTSEVNLYKILGHERLETTAIYTQPNERDLEQAVEKLSVGEK